MNNSNGETVPQEMLEAVEMVLETVEGQVFYSRDFPQALIISNDSKWIVRVSEDGTPESAYLSTEPIRSYVSTVEDTYTVNMLPDLEGFATGFPV